MSKNPVSLKFIKLVADGLGDLNAQAVFVGGATIPFYLPKEMIAAARPTEDIDVVIELVRSIDREKFERQLRQKGFEHDRSEGAPICRWKFKGVTVDIMSSDEKVMGFTNRWYAEGTLHAVAKVINGTQIKILALPYFLATKFEAFKGRGNGDFMGSPDMEDIVTILDAASTDLFEDQLSLMNKDILKYLKTEFIDLLESREFLDALPGHIFDRVNAADRAESVVKRIEKMVRGNTSSTKGSTK